MSRNSKTTYHPKGFTIITTILGEKYLVRTSGYIAHGSKEYYTMRVDNRGIFHDWSRSKGGIQFNSDHIVHEKTN